MFYVWCLPLWLEHQLRICRVELAFALIAAWLKTGDPDGAAAFPRNKDFVSSRAGKRPIENQAVLAVSHTANADPDLPKFKKILSFSRLRTRVSMPVSAHRGKRNRRPKKEN
jgi:hypothetical protein